MKKKKSSPRNEYVAAMNKSRKGGKMRSKKDKRKNGKNDHRTFLQEAQETKD